VLGIAVGWFLNMLIYRVPQGESVLSRTSACPGCGVPIEGRDNIPVISWFLLRGHCRCCHAPISLSYLLVELASAGLFARTAARFGYDWDLPAFLVLFAGLLALACIDLKHHLLPKRIVYPVFALVGALLLVDAAATHRWHELAVAAICGMVWFVVFLTLNFISPRLLGFGDVRLAPVLGLALGWLGGRYAFLGFFAANLIAAVVGIALIMTKKISRQEPIPYGVFLGLGCVVAVFAGPALLRSFNNY
jgi:leader peptidase (prepilin peptidase)/N-methyltransferase